MGMFTEKRPMHVDHVAVINGPAGEDWLYEVGLTDPATGSRLTITDWGRELKVPVAGRDVEVRAARGTWKEIDAASRSGRFPELSGLDRIDGPRKNIDHVGLFNYYDGTKQDPTPSGSQLTHISTTLMRWLENIISHLDPKNRKREIA